MTEILKQDFPKYEGTFRQEESDDQAKPEVDQKAKRKKIIKAHEAAHQVETRKIPTMGSTNDSPTIRPLGSGKFLEGVEVVCRCGEKIVIHFDYE